MLLICNTYISGIIGILLIFKRIIKDSLSSRMQYNLWFLQHNRLKDAIASYLMNFAEKVSLTPFPYAASLSGNMKQMKQRIINIASYEKPPLGKSLKGITAFLLTAVLLLGLAPILSTYAVDEQLGAASVYNYIQEIGYGNKT